MRCNVHQNHDHVHGSGCGHESVQHEDHLDYLHDGHLHHQHGDHVDEHAVAENMCDRSTLNSNIIPSSTA